MMLFFLSVVVLGGAVARGAEPPPRVLVYTYNRLGGILWAINAKAP